MKLAIGRRHRSMRASLLGIGRKPSCIPRRSPRERLHALGRRSGRRRDGPPFNRRTQAQN